MRHFFADPVAESVPFDTDNNDFPSSVEDVQAAIEYAKQNAEGFPRAGVPLISNGTMSNNEWLTYSELTPERKIIFPVKTKINEITWDNNNGNVSFDLEFYKNGTSPSDLFWTYEVRNNANGWAYVTGLNFQFEAGDWIRIKYKDKGANCVDMVMVLWISRIV